MRTGNGWKKNINWKWFADETSLTDSLWELWMQWKIFLHVLLVSVTSHAYTIPSFLPSADGSLPRRLRVPSIKQQPTAASVIDRSTDLRRYRKIDGSGECGSRTLGSAISREVHMTTYLVADVPVDSRLCVEYNLANTTGTPRSARISTCREDKAVSLSGPYSKSWTCR